MASNKRSSRDGSRRSRKSANGSRRRRYGHAKTRAEIIAEARAAARAEGRRGFPKHVADLAEEITNVVTQERHRLTPYSIAVRFGLMGSQAQAVLDADVSATGPGGKGYAWMVRKVARIIQGKSQ
jgi:hypothetical protein